MLFGTSIMGIPTMSDETCRFYSFSGKDLRTPMGHVNHAQHFFGQNCSKGLTWKAVGVLFIRQKLLVLGVFCCLKK